MDFNLYLYYEQHKRRYIITVLVCFFYILFVFGFFESFLLFLLMK